LKRLRKSTVSAAESELSAESRLDIAAANTAATSSPVRIGGTCVFTKCGITWSGVRSAGSSAGEVLGRR
jgi:hypothetical protein